MNNTVSENCGFSPVRLGRISTLMQRYVDDGKLAGLIATVARRGQTVYMEKFGMMDIEAHKPMQFDAIFRIASMTKPITSVAVMTLYEEGHFHLNTPVAEFIPGFKEARVFVGERANEGYYWTDLDRPITFRHLFTHTAGLSYGWNVDDPVDRQYQKAQKESGVNPATMTVKDLVQMLTTLPLAFQPGTHWRYSYAIDVLGYIAEVISGKPLDVFLKERLFEPLGMVDTDFYVPPAKADRLCALYGHPNNAPTLQLVESPLGNQFQKPSFLSGGGGLVSTVHDYARFAQMLANGGELDGERILSPTTVALYSINHMPEAALPYGFADREDLYHWGYGYSLGTRVLMDVSKSGIAGSVGEFGWDGAFSTYFWVDPQEALYGLLMLQHAPNAYYPIAPQFKQLTYQALVA
ncbi:MAG TPA: serine hydrolase domain-containing protein [Anaerolineae bacterium]|nr:serine hydrolase domain-containing protein [Anaerolineae bacterium]HQH36988.1 serine hydrolase domain-containing protein [Anaerolineae bacterium]